MVTSCEIIPTLSNGEDSPLWKGLIKYTKGDRKIAAQAYNISRTPTFRKMDGVELDDTGEVSLKTLIDKLHLDKIVDDDNNTKEKLEVGAIASDGTQKSYKNYKDIGNSVMAFNQTNPSKVASVTRGTDGFVSDVENITIKNAGLKDDVVFQNTLNERLRGIMNGLGFDVAVVESDDFAGRFSPVDAETNANGLLTVIQIAKGQQGEEAFPEEFAHFYIAGMHNHPLVQRLLDMLDEDDVKEILGDQYENYAKRYNKDFMRIREEAAGKLLAAHIMGTPIILTSKETPKSLLQRIWNWIKKSVLGIDSAVVDNLMVRTSSTLQEIQDNILDDKDLMDFDKVKVFESETFYKLDKKIKNLHDLAEEALNTELKRLSLVQRRDRTKKISSTEAKTLKDINAKIERNENYTSILVFLKQGATRMQQIITELKNIEKDVDNGIFNNPNIRTKGLKKAAAALRSMYDFINVYGDFVEQIMLVDKVSDKVVLKDLSDKQVDDLKNAARSFDLMIREANSIYNGLRKTTVYEFFKDYWGDDKVATMGEHKGEAYTLETLLDTAEKDISIWDRWTMAMSDASDPLLSLYDRIVKSARMRVDNRLKEYLYRIGRLQEMAEKNRINTEFMFVKDEDGKLTGGLISDIDYNKYYKERREQREKIKNSKDSKGKEYSETVKYRLMRNWEKRHTETVKVTVNGITREEKRPKKSMYPSDALDKLTPEQRAYYDEAMKIKEELTVLTPRNVTRVHQAVMMRKSGLQSVKPKSLWKRLLDKISYRETELEYGDTDSINIDATKDKNSEKKRYVTVDAHGQVLDQIPLYYTHRLTDEDMSDLNTDFSASLMAFAASAVNYDEMTNIVDLLELSKQQLLEREVKQLSNGAEMVRRFKARGKELEEPYTRKVSDNGIKMGALLNEYTLTAVYGKSKNAGQTITIGNREIMLNKVGDALKNYVSILGIGVNVFSGINNAIMGTQQILINTAGKRLFGIKDFMAIEPEFVKGLWGRIAQLGKSVKDNKMDMLVTEYDCLDDFYDGLTRLKTYNSPLYRMVSEGFESMSFMMQEIGEYYLHVAPLYAMLHAIKAKDADGNDTNLLDSYEVVKDENDEKAIPVLRVKPGTLVMKMDNFGNALDKDGNKLTKEEVNEGSKVVWEEFTDEMFQKKKQQLKALNHRMHGAYGKIDKGMLNRNIFGRFIMQFRQWMPASIDRRYGRAHWDSSMDDWVEGYYLTLWRYTTDALKDRWRFKSQYALLNEQERANIRMALIETLLRITLMAVLGKGLFGVGDDDDDDKWVDTLDTWIGRQLKYQLLRLYMETAALTPGLSLPQEFLKIVRSPMAGINVIQDIFNVLKISMWTDKYESGRFEGKPKAYKSLTELIPWYSQIEKARTLKDEDYAFTVFEM